MMQEKYWVENEWSLKKLYTYVGYVEKFSAQPKRVNVHLAGTIISWPP